MNESVQICKCSYASYAIYQGHHVLGLIPQLSFIFRIGLNNVVQLIKNWEEKYRFQLVSTSVKGLVIAFEKR